LIFGTPLTKGLLYASHLQGVDLLKRNAETGAKIVDELPRRMFEEFPSAIREAIGLMIDGGMLIDRCYCLRSGISVVRVEAADGYSVGTLIAYELQTAIDTFR
jgi:hypothetical protein